MSEIEKPKVSKQIIDRRTGLDLLIRFNNHFSTEAIEGALPIGQNSPQRHPMSPTAFAGNPELIDNQYGDCWLNLLRN